MGPAEARLEGEGASGGVGGAGARTAAFDESKFEPLPEVEINPRDEYWVDPDKLDDGLPDADPRIA